MKRPTRSVAAGGDSREPMREALPRQSSPVATGTPVVVLSPLDAEKLRARVMDLLEFADEVGVTMVSIFIHKVSEGSAFEAFPEGLSSAAQLPARLHRTWDVRRGRHDVHLYTRSSVAEDAGRYPLGASVVGSSESEAPTTTEADS